MPQLHELHEVKCSEVFGGPCSSTTCSQHGGRNKALRDWSHGRRPAPSRVEFAGEVLPRTGWLGVVPLAPRRRRALGGVAAVAAGLAFIAGGVLLAAGVVYFIHLLHLGGGR